jgi:glycosyltransferase involved in cell wall biosynthesis
MESIYSQDIPESACEVICINDCSPDNTRDIIIEYQKRHQNLVLIDHPENKGQNGGRNTGIEAAHGKYLWFIDQDDYIEKNCLKKLLNILNDNQLDILNFNVLSYNIWKEPKVSPVYDIPNNTEKVISGIDWLKTLKNCNTNSGLWRKIFRREYLIENQFSLPARRLYEDEMFSLAVVAKAKRFIHLNNSFYYYRANPNSILNQAFTVVNHLSLIEVAADCFEFYLKAINEDKVFAEKVKADIALEHLDFTFQEIPYLNFSHRKYVMKILNPHLPIIQKSSYFKGIKKFYFDNFRFSNALFFIVSPVFRQTRRLKSNINKMYKQIKRKIKKIVTQ